MKIFATFSASGNEKSRNTIMSFKFFLCCLDIIFSFTRTDYRGNEYYQPSFFDLAFFVFYFGSLNCPTCHGAHICLSNTVVIFLLTRTEYRGMNERNGCHAAIFDKEIQRCRHIITIGAVCVDRNSFDSTR